MKKVGLGIMLFGLAGIVLPLLADFFGLGKSGIQAFQMLGIQAGVFFAAFGWGIFQENRELKQLRPFSLKLLFSSIERVPVIVWIFAGFMLVYFSLFVIPVFLNKDFRMYYFINYIPSKYPIGVDIKNSIEYVIKWYATGQSPYVDGVYSYPPLFNIFMSIFVLFGYPSGYFLVLILSFFSFIGITLSYILAVREKSSFDFVAISFFLGTGLFSYGLLFELERGQLNLFAVFLTVVAVVLFHYRPSFRLLAYLLFTVAVQIKVYPAIFIFLFVEDWRAWKSNIMRMAVLGLLNFSALFVMGYQQFTYFVISIMDRLNTRSRWPGNHSIYNFVWNLTHGGLGMVSPEVSRWLNQYASGLRIFLMIYVLACILLIILKAYRDRASGLNRYLLSACTIGAMLIPSESQDYKLSILAPVLAILFSDKALLEEIRQRFIGIFGVLSISIAYSIALFPYKYRPEFLQISFLVLFMILTAVTILALLRKNNSLVVQ